MSNHKTATLNRNGMCPYCNCECFTTGITEERHFGQTKVQCQGCQNWSVRNHRNGVQYPLSKPTDKDSMPVNKVVYEVPTV